MNKLVENIYDDLLTAQDIIGSEFIYEEHSGALIAVALDYDGNETARYRVEVLLEKL